jgi:hypothetical protein
MVAALARVTATIYLELKMAKVFTSRTNGLELHIPADMGSAARFFSVGEDARKVIDDGSTSTRTDDPDQLKSELARAKARLEVLEAKEAENNAREAAAAAVVEEPRATKTSKRSAPVVESDLD